MNSIFDAFELIGKFLDPNVYGADNILSDDDISYKKIFALFQNKESMLFQFKEHNLKHYEQGLNSKNFINKFHHAIGRPKLHKGSFSAKQFAYIYNIPVLVVETLPWDDPDDDIREMGNFYDVGIVAVHYEGIILTIEHELIHAMNYWLRKGDIFAKPSNPISKIKQPTDPMAGVVYEIFKAKYFGGTNFDRVLGRLRDETIAYLLATPGRIYKRDFDFAVQSLTGRSKEKLQTILGQNAELIFSIVRLVKEIDKGDKKITRLKLCKAMMKHSSLVEIIRELKTN